MKVAIVAPGPIRSFSLCYQSWVENLILPLENQIGKNNVKIFMDNSIITEDIFNKELKNAVFTTKLGTDTYGWEHIIKNSPYIAQHTTYQYNDQYIEDIFTKINKANNTNYDPYSLKNYTKVHHYKYKYYYMLIQGICLNYNNKKLIDLIPDEYDIIIKIRPDVYLMKPYPINKVLDIKNNTIYLQNKISPLYKKYKNHKNRQSIIKKLGKIYYPIPKLHKKNFLLGKRWDNFYMGTRSTLVQLYDNYFYYCHTILNKFINHPNVQTDCKAESILKKLIVEEKIRVDSYLYHGAADKGFNLAKNKNINVIDFAKKNNINWFIFKDENCIKLTLAEHYSK